MAKYSGSGWHHQSVRHSNARKYGHAGGKYKLKKVKSFYWSTLDVDNEEDARLLAKYNPEQQKAQRLAEKIKGIVKTKSYPEDEGHEYIVYKKHYGKTKDKKYVNKLKRRFNKLDNIPYDEVSKNDLEEMQEIRNELIKLGYGDWNR